VEFIADQDGTFYFMEMNTRLQVEHPVTEMITGLDLVEWQLRVAAGERLPLLQDGIAMRGHAIEARVYAEDPDKGFLPATGTIAHLAFPPASANVRIDTGVTSGDAITPHYDPMIAKLIVWDVDRAQALARMREALAAVQIVGLTTNVAFLQRLVACTAFASADLDTGLIERERDALFRPETPAGDTPIVLVVLHELLRLAEAARAIAAQSADPHSPWSRSDGWRLNEDNHHVFVLKEGERQTAVTVHYRDTGYEIELDGARRTLRGHVDAGGRVRAWLDDRAFAGEVIARGALRDVFANGARHAFELHDPMLHEVDAEVHGGGLAAPMPGKVIAVLVQAGVKVEKGAPLVIMEAMKMEHTINAPAAGTVKEILYAAGEQVAEGAELIAFEPAK
jgi:3-methylcrotonyl-CoA carboxylase alpha subunit